MEQETESMPTPISIFDTWTIQNQTFCIVWKPVGMRTRGHFHAATLEECLSRQLGPRFRSLSNLDKGCSGLCVLQPAHDAPLVVRHTFTALVYGHCPPQWKEGISIVLPVEGVRRWKKLRKEPRDFSGDDEEENPVASMLPKEESTAILTLVEQTTTEPHLSTVTMCTTSQSSGLAQTIAYFLRRRDHPVVGDRMAAQEYISLPRSMRNRLKQRWCLGCSGVALLLGGEERHSRRPVPDFWSALYWQNFGQRQQLPNSSSERKECS
jgi:hypothetical protein